MIHYLFGGKGPTVDTENSCPANLLRTIRNNKAQRPLQVWGLLSKVSKMYSFSRLVTRQKPPLIVCDSKMCVSTSKSRLVCRQITACAQNLRVNQQFRIAFLDFLFLFCLNPILYIFTFNLDVLSVAFILIQIKLSRCPVITSTLANK